MRMAFALCLAFAAACAPQRASLPAVEKPSSTDAWPADWSAQVGQIVTLEGRAGNAKLGAVLLGNGDLVWIDGLADWPENIMRGESEGVRLRVTGKVIRKDDVPVFINRPDESPRAGVPVSSEEELQSRKWRYLLADAKWSVLV